MAKMRHPPPEAGPSRVNGVNGVHSPTSIKRKRKRDESVAASDSDAPEVDVSLSKVSKASNGETPSQAQKNKKKKKRKKRKLAVTSENAVREASAPASTQRPPDAKEPSSSRVTSKGKQKATDDYVKEDQQSTNGVTIKARHEEVFAPSPPQASTIVVEMQKAFMKTLGQNLTCQICLEPMFSPFTLAPCGHTACYDCLVSWFRAPLPADQGGADTGFLALHSPQLLHKKKKCPHCRTVVQALPAEAWSIKSIVASLFANSLSSDLFPGVAMPQEMASTRTTGGGAWDGLFRKDAPGGIFQRAALDNFDIFMDDDDDLDLDDVEIARIMDRHMGDAMLGDGVGGSDSENEGFLDAEDGVRRCTQCLHEIWDGVCSHCDHVYPRLVGLHSEEDIDSDEDLDPGVRARLVVGAADDGSEDSYESSFIDDDGREDRHPRRKRRSVAGRRRHSVIQITSDEGDEDSDGDGEEDDSDEDSTESDDDSDDDGSQPSKGRRRSKRDVNGTENVSDDSEDPASADEDDEVEYEIGRARRHGRNARIFISSDGDDEDVNTTAESEFEGRLHRPYRASTRANGTSRRRRALYDEDEGEDDDKDGDEDDEDDEDGEQLDIRYSDDD